MSTEKRPDESSTAWAIRQVQEEARAPLHLALRDADAALAGVVGAGPRDDFRLDEARAAIAFGMRAARGQNGGPSDG